MSTNEPPGTPGGLVAKVTFLRKFGNEVTFQMSDEDSEYFNNEGAIYLGQFWLHGEQSKG